MTPEAQVKAEAEALRLEAEMDLAEVRRALKLSQQEIGQTLAIGMLAFAGIGGFIVLLITMFKPTIARWTAPIYAALDGVLLGAISQVV